MARRSTLRASDADREHVAERLRHAAVEGRLLAEELEHRLAAALRARTYGELDPLIADLPSRQVVRRHRTTQVVTQAAVGVLAITLIALGALFALLMAIWLVTGVFAMWMLWVAFAWIVLGRRGRWIRAPRHRPPFGIPPRHGLPRHGPPHHHRRRSAF